MVWCLLRKIIVPCSAASLSILWQNNSIWQTCVTCLDVQKTSEISYRKLLRKLSIGGDVEFWLKNWLRFHKVKE